MTTLIASNNVFDPLAEWLGMPTSFVIYLLLAGLIIATVCIAMCWFSSQKTRLLKQNLERLQHDFRVSNNSAIGMGQKIMALEKQLKKADVQQCLSHQVADKIVQKEHVSGSNEDSKYKPRSQTNNEKNASVNRQKKSTAQLSVVSSNNFSIDDLNNPKSDEAEEDVAYELSKQLLDQGYSVEDIMSKCGLSYSEVSLMKSLSKR